MFRLNEAMLIYFQCTLKLRSLRVDLGIGILLRWIQVLGCVLDYKSFRSLGAELGYFKNKNKKDETNNVVEDNHATPYLMKCLDNIFSKNYLY